jgi:acetyl esterase
MQNDPLFDIHGDMAELVAAKRAVPQGTDADTLRAGWNQYGARLRRPYPDGMVVEDTAFDVAGATPRKIALRIYRPRNAPQPSPCVLYLHGGGFVKGSLESGDAIAWGIAEQVGVVVVSIDYRLAPEHPYPAAVEDCYAAAKYIAGHGSALGVDVTRLAVWGDSAGGNLAAALCLMARDRGEPRIVAQAIHYPCLTDDLSSNTYRDYALSPGLTAASMDRNWDLYLGGKRPSHEAYAAPLKAPDLSGLPPAHIHVAEIDPLADDGRDYARRLERAGCSVELRVAERMIHGFLRARFTGSAAAAEFARPCAFLRAALLN